MIEFFSKPWPWYIAGPLIGLMVPLLLLMGNKMFGISSSLRHVCAAVIPANISFFKYDWKKEIWNLFFVAGVLALEFTHFADKNSDKVDSVHDMTAFVITLFMYFSPVKEVVSIFLLIRTSRGWL